ncbi:HD domain-containing protein [Candidatus Gracilibacteria bacterium 28_42_T64]|nr:HD domain-containing protein [Candidatus Gracilibacteria bacterium 28_42_T64]
MYGNLSTSFNEILSSLNEKDRGLLKDVYDFSYNAHFGQKRKSGEDYFIHPLAVGINLWNKFGDINLFCAGLLHDAVEDNDNIHPVNIYTNFGEDIGFLVDSVTKNEPSFYNGTKVFEKKIDKLIDGGCEDIRCFLLKLADREDNLKTLSNLKNNKQVRMAFETQAIFTPLEELIGYKEIKSVKEGDRKFQEILKKNNIEDSCQLKDYLIKSTFHDFTNSCFDTVYQNSGNVTWKIKNKETFEDLLKIPNIDDKIDIESIEHKENGEFLVNFKFKKGEIMNYNVKLGIGDTYSFD